MAASPRLTPEQWAIARRRWEGCDLPGFDWLVPEVVAAFEIPVTRQGLSVRAKRDGWTKGGEPSQPLAEVPFAEAVLGPGPGEGFGKPRPVAKPFRQHGLPTAEEIAAASFDITVCQGIYFLLKRGAVVYIGQSANVFTRIGQHMRDAVKLFDAVSYIPCEAALLDSMETLLINVYKPPLNGRTGDGGFQTPMPLLSILKSKAG